MSELNTRVESVEQQVKELGRNYLSVDNGESSKLIVLDILAVLWRRKWFLLLITFLFSSFGVIYSLSLPNIYNSEGIYAPVVSDGGGLASGYSGLAAITGIDLSSEGSDVDQALSLVSSWQFLDSVVEKYNLKPLIVAVDGWDKSSATLVWNDKLYDSESKLWTRLVSSGSSSEPSSYQTYKVFRKMVIVSRDAKTSMITVRVQHFSPILAKKWVDIVVFELNEHFRNRDIAESKAHINYLNKKINETSITEMQSVFYGMVESKMKTLMLAEVGEEYLLKTVVPSKEPEVKASPRRAVICVMFTILGGLISVFFVLGAYFLFDQK